MIIHISASGIRRLLEADDFRKFKIVAAKQCADGEALRKALGGIATLSDDGAHAWIDPGAFMADEDASRGGEWQTAFMAMIKAAEKYGYVDSETGAVRAHIEVED